MTDLNPFDPAKQDVEKRLKRLRNRVQDFLKTFTTATLLKTLGGSVLAIVVAALNFPVFAIAVVTVVIVALCIYAIYATKIMKAQDRANRWAYVDGKRIMQETLEARIAMDTVTLALMEGERHAPTGMRSASPELRSALAHLLHRLRLAEERAEAAEAVKEGTATAAQQRTHVRFQRQRDAEPPRGPAVGPIKARRAALHAKRKQLEAEIQSLAMADSIARAMQAEEVKGTRRTRRDLEDAARKADQAARERARAGRQPTQPEPEHTITLGITPNGERDVSTGRGKPTPEQIAKGQDAEGAA
jgi:hypothetical protein